MTKRTILGVVACLAILLAAGLALFLPRHLESKAFISAQTSANSAFKRQEYEKAATAFAVYLKRYPNGRHAEQANRKVSLEIPRLIDDREWSKARENDKLAGYQGYLQRFPNGRHGKEAAVCLRDAEAWASARKIGTIDSYKAYRKQFPSGNRVAEAEGSIADLQLAEKAQTVFAAGRAIYIFGAPSSISSSQLNTDIHFEYMISRQGFNGGTPVIVVRKVDTRGLAEECMLFRSTGPDPSMARGGCSFLISAFSDEYRSIQDEALGIKHRTLGPIDRIEVVIARATEEDGSLLVSGGPISNVLRIPVR